MGRGALAAVAVITLLCSAGRVQAEDKEPFAVLELGGAGEWSFPDATHVLGPSIAVEFDVIKEWLEIEAGTSTLFRRGHTEWGTELLFKKPFTLSDKVEFMFGVGPAWSYTTGGEGSKVAGEAAFDFMIWPWADRKYGWFVEPTYSYSFNKGHEKSLGISAGLLISIP
jgi:hypothetical protein